MEVICQKTGSNKLITTGNTYEVLNETENRYTLINDKGVQKNYCKSLFSLVDVQPVREVLPTRVLNEISLDVEVNTYGDAIDVNISYTDNLNLHSQNNESISRLYLADTNISCGIHQLSGLNNLFKGIDDILNALNNNYSNLPNDVRLEVDLNDLPTKSDILKEVLSQITEEANTSLILLSTNITNNEYICDEYTDTLDELSVATTTALNPNSDNTIALWTLNCNE